MRWLAVRLVTVVVIAVSLAACGSDGDEQISTSADFDDASEEAVAQVEPTIAPEPTEPATTEPTEPTEPEPTSEPAAVAQVGDGLFPTVVAADASSSDGVTWRFNVTLLSEYDSPARYADAWRVLDADDNELGVRVLGHDHANEQPFTRSHTVEVPGELTTVFIEGRDQINGWSGERFELTLDR